MSKTNTQKINSGKTLTRAHLSEALYQKIGFSRHECETIVDWVIEKMITEMSHGNNVKIAGFGSFIIREKSARIGRNPKTGEEAEISARKIVSFKPSAQVKTKLNVSPLLKEVGETFDDHD